MLDILRWTLHWLFAPAALPYTPVAERTFIVPAESRIFDVGAESRIFVVEE